MSVTSSCQNEDQICCYRSISSSGIRCLWEITSACNLECDFCLVEKKYRQLPIERALEIAQDLIDSGVDKFIISGGEPLVYRDILKLLKFLVDRGVLVKLLTNGTIHKPEVFEFVRQTPSVEVSLSLLSVDENKADQIFRKEGSFQKIMEAIDQLPRQRLNIITACSNMNLDEIGEVIDWVATKGIPCISVINIFKDPTSKARFLDDCRIYKIQPAHVEQVMNLIQRKREEYRGQMVIRTTQFQGQGGELCGAGRSVLYLDSTGCLLPCTLTDNEPHREAVQNLSIKEAIRYCREMLPALPTSSCVPLLGTGSSISHHGQESAA